MKPTNTELKHAVDKLRTNFNMPYILNAHTHLQLLGQPQLAELCVWVYKPILVHNIVIDLLYHAHLGETPREISRFYWELRSYHAGKAYQARRETNPHADLYKEVLAFRLPTLYHKNKRKQAKLREAYAVLTYAVLVKWLYSGDLHQIEPLDTSLITAGKSYRYLLKSIKGAWYEPAK